MCKKGYHCEDYNTMSMLELLLTTTPQSSPTQSPTKPTTTLPSRAFDFESIFQEHLMSQNADFEEPIIVDLVNSAPASAVVTASSPPRDYCLADVSMSSSSAASGSTVSKKMDKTLTTSDFNETMSNTSEADSLLTFDTTTQWENLTNGSFICSTPIKKTSCFENEKYNTNAGCENKNKKKSLVFSPESKIAVVPPVAIRHRHNLRQTRQRENQKRKLETLGEVDEVDSSDDFDTTYPAAKKVRSTSKRRRVELRLCPSNSRRRQTSGVASSSSSSARSYGYPRIVLPRQEPSSSSDILIKQAYGDKFETVGSMPNIGDVRELLKDLDQRVEKVHERAVTARCGIQASLAHTRLGQYLRHISTRFAKECENGQSQKQQQESSDPRSSFVFDFLSGPIFREARYLPPRFVDHPTSGNVPNPTFVKKPWICTGSFLPIFSRDKYENYFISDLQIWVRYAVEENATVWRCKSLSHDFDDSQLKTLVFELNSKPKTVFPWPTDVLHDNLDYGSERAALLLVCGFIPLPSVPAYAQKSTDYFKMLQELNIIKNLAAPSATQMLCIWDRLETVFHRLSVANLHRDLFCAQTSDNEIEALMHERFRNLRANISQNNPLNSEGVMVPLVDAYLPWHSRVREYACGIASRFMPQSHSGGIFGGIENSPLNDSVNHLLQALPSIWSGRRFMMPLANLLKLYLFALSHQPFTESPNCMHIFGATQSSSTCFTESSI